MRSVAFGLFVAAFWMGLGLALTEGLASLIELRQVQLHIARDSRQEPQTPALAESSAHAEARHLR